MNAITGTEGRFKNKRVFRRGNRDDAVATGSEKRIRLYGFSSPNKTQEFRNYKSASLVAKALRALSDIVGESDAVYLVSLNMFRPQGDYILPPEYDPKIGGLLLKSLSELKTEKQFLELAEIPFADVSRAKQTQGSILKMLQSKMAKNSDEPIV